MNISKFEINTMTLKKLGWTKSENQWGLRMMSIPMDSEYHFLKGEMTYYIAKLQGDNIEYTFNSYHTKPDVCVVGVVIPTPTTQTKISSNSELFKKIIEAEAFSEDYIRHFRIFKILNQ